MANDRITALENENAYLKERILQLEEALGSKISVPSVFDLSPTEDKMLAALLRRDLVTKEQFMLAMYGDLDDAPMDKIVHTLMHRLRNKLGKFGIIVKTVHGRGYRLTSEMKRLGNGLVAAQGTKAA